MYNTSEAYKQAIQSGYIKSRIELTIAPVNGQQIAITDANILPGSLGINNRATSSGEFSYGSVYVGQFNVTLIDVEEEIDRYSLFNAQVTATFVQVLSEIEEERIPLGTYYVNNPTRKKKTIGLECYDAMTRFDVPLTEATFGTPYDLLAYLCAFVGVPLGMTQEEVNAMPNGNVQFTFAKYASMTARDALSNIAKVLCGFATIDRSGRLVIRRFGAESIDTISSGSRTSSTIADYQTFFVAVTVSVTADGEEKSITALTGREDGLVLDLGNIPIAQGSATAMQAMVQTIADELAEVIYTPATCEIISNPAYDLGDMVQLTGVNNSQVNVLSVITAIDWKYHGKMKIVGDGRNALLNAVKSSEAKLIDNFANTMSENAYDVKVYTNASQIGLTSVAMPIITMNYSVYKNTTTVFLATIPLFMELDGEAIFGYHLNNEEIEEVKVYLEHGWHAVTLTNYFANESQSQNKLVVTCRTAYFESDKRVQDAQISGLIDAVETGEYVMGEIDTTIPSAYIPLTSIKSIIFASGLNTTESWDGTILMVDELGAVMLGASGITVKPIEDLPIVATNSNNTKPTITEQIPAITLGSSTLTVEQIVEAVSIGRKILFLTIDTSRANEYTYDRGKVAIIDDEFVLNQTYPFPSTRDTIDSGSMKKCDVDVSGITPSAMTVVASGEDSGRLPSAYQEVDYIGFGGSQYIDTLAYGGSDVSTEIVVGAFSPSYDAVILGAQHGRYDTSSYYWYGDTRRNGMSLRMLAQDTMLPNGSFSTAKWKLIYDADSDVVKTINLTSMQEYQASKVPPSVYRTQDTLWLGGLNDSGSLLLYPFVGRIYSCKIWYDYGGTLVRDFVPCYRKADNVVGLYDLVSEEFFVNSGSGSFTKGDDVSVEYKTLLADDTNVYNLGNEEIESVLAEIEYKQNLHGYDYPWVGGGGKNIANMNGSTMTATKNPTDAIDIEIGMVVVGISRLGYLRPYASYSVSGDTATFSASQSGYGIGFVFSATEGVTYTVSSGESLYKNISFYDANKKYISAGTNSSAVSKSGTAPTGAKYGIYLIVPVQTNTDYTTTKIQVEVGSSATAWTPYANICPIEGHTSVDINVNGGNLFPYDELMDVSFYDATDDLLDIFNSLEAGNYEINMKAVITSVTGTGDWFCGLVAFNSGSTNVIAEEMMTATPYVGQEVDLSRTVYISPEHVGNFTRIEIYGCAFGSTNPKGTADISPFALISEPDTYTMQFSVEGTNIFTRDNETDGKYLTSSGGYTNNANYAVSDYLEIEPQKRYVIVGGDHVTATAVYHAWYDENETFIRSEQWNQEFIISPSNAKYLRVSYRKAGAPTSVHVEVGIVPHGVVDVATGVLSVDYAYISDLSYYNYAVQSDALNFIFRTYPLSNMKQPETASERLEGIASSGYRISLVTGVNANMTPYSMLRNSNRLFLRNDDYAGDVSAFQSSMSGVQVVYELDEPCVYHLTPEEVETLVSKNVISASTGNVTVELTSGRVLTGQSVEFDSRATVVMQVGLLTNLDAEMFEDYGFDDLADMQDALTSIFSLGEFSILRWCNAVETASTMLATVTGVPGVQDIITPAFGITASHVTGIELTETDTSGSPWVAVKFDSGAWEYYDFTDEQWEEVGTGTLGHMTVADLEGLTEEIWAEKFTNASTMQTKLTLPTANDTIALVRYKFLQEEE